MHALNLFLFQGFHDQGYVWMGPCAVGLGGACTHVVNDGTGLITLTPYCEDDLAARVP